MKVLQWHATATEINKNTSFLPVKSETPTPGFHNVEQSLLQVNVVKNNIWFHIKMCRAKCSTLDFTRQYVIYMLEIIARG